MNNYTYNLV